MRTLWGGGGGGQGKVGGLRFFLWGGGSRYGHFYLKNEAC